MSENYKIDRRKYGVTLMPFDKTFYNYGKGFNIYSNISIRWDSMVLIPREHYHPFKVF